MSSNLIIIWAYLTLCIFLGFFRIPKMKSLKDYSIGSTRFSTAVLTFSMIATAIGPIETMGEAEKSFSLGIVFVITSFLSIIHWGFFGRLLAPSLSYFKQNKCITLVDIMNLFYGKWGRYICTASVVLSIALLSIFYKSAAIILQKYLNIPLVHGAAIITIAIAMYSIFGGIHAVVITDTVQFFIFMTVIPLIFFLGFQNVDIPQTLNNVPYEKLHITTNDIPLLISFLIYGLIPTTGWPFIQRALMASNSNQVKKIFDITGVFTCIFYLMMGCIGLIAAGINPEIQSDDALLFFIDEVVPSSLMGFVAVSFLAIIMSTASSFLNATTVIIIKDVITPNFPSLNSNKKQLILTKLVGVIIAFASFGMIFVKDHIMDMLWMLDNFWDPFVSIPLVMALLGIRIKKDNFKYVLISALTAVLTARAFHDAFDTFTLSIGVIASIFSILYFKDKSIVKDEKTTDVENSEIISDHI